MGDGGGDYQRDYLLRLPLPLAQLYSRAYNAKDPRGRHDNGFYLCEALVKLLVAPAAACYLEECRREQARSSAVDRSLAALALPSLGQWVGMLRELARHFGARVDAPSHPLGGLQGKLTKRQADRPALSALYRRIKNGPDGEQTGDTTCSVLELFDALVPYRNGVFGHGGNRFESFYADDLGPLLFPALNELLSEGTLEIVGPAGARLAYITELRTLDDGRVQVGLRELVGLQGERAAPLELPVAQARELLPNRVVALWPGRATPLRLDPLLQYRESELAEEVLFLNRDRNARQVEYLSYTTGRTERDRAMQPTMSALLSDVAGRTIDEAELKQLAERSLAESPSFEALLGLPVPAAQTIGDYELLAELGRGAMGVVYLARQLSLGRLVALKMLPSDLAADDVALARFRREIRHLARCDHPHIVKVLGSGTAADGRLYYAMEYVPGSDLEQVWRELAEKSGSASTATLGTSTWAHAVHAAGSKARSRADGSRSGKAKSADNAPRAAVEEASPLPPMPELPIDLPDAAGDYVRRVVVLVRDTARALQVVHDQGITHRDVKPGNLMITPDGGRVVLMDFGLAKGHTQHTMAVSQSGGFLGTLRYAAPEQLAAAKLKVGPQADIRALGVTLWEVLTRRRLFAEAEDEAALAAAVYDRDVPRLRVLEPGFDRDLEAITARACERRTSDRIATASQLADYLQLWLDGKPLPIRTPGLGELARRWVRERKTQAATIAGAVVLVVTVTAAAFALINRAREDAIAAKNDALQSEQKAIAAREEAVVSGQRVIAAKNEAKEELRGRMNEIREHLPETVALVVAKMHEFDNELPAALAEYDRALPSTAEPKHILLLIERSRLLLRIAKTEAESVVAAESAERAVRLAESDTLLRYLALRVAGLARFNAYSWGILNRKPAGEFAECEAALSHFAEAHRMTMADPKIDDTDQDRFAWRIAQLQGLTQKWLISGKPRDLKSEIVGLMDEVDVNLSEQQHARLGTIRARINQY